MYDADETEWADDDICLQKPSRSIGTTDNNEDDRLIVTSSTIQEEAFRHCSQPVTKRRLKSKCKLPKQRYDEEEVEWDESTELLLSRSALNAIASENKSKPEAIKCGTYSIVTPVEPFSSDDFPTLHVGLITATLPADTDSDSRDKTAAPPVHPPDTTLMVGKTTHDSIIREYQDSNILIEAVKRRDIATIVQLLKSHGDVNSSDEQV